MEKNDIRDNYGPYEEMFDCIEQAVLKENRGLTRLDWQYFIDQDGEKVVFADMESPILGQLRAEQSTESTDENGRAAE